MTDTTRPTTRSRLTRVVITLACLIAVGAVLWQLLPKSAFSSDLSQVGQGQPALVMLREIHVMGGEQVAEHMAAVYPEFADRMIFLVVHTGHPDGQAFAAEHQLGDGSLVLFDGAGNVVARTGRPGSPAALREFLNQS